MSKIVFTEIGFEQYQEWQKEDKKILKRINDLIKSIDREGAMSGLGKPEKLKHREGEYSRRINEEHRLVYEVEDDKIIVKACKGHYEE